MGKRTLNDRTVLLLTHEFNTVIDMVYNLPCFLTLAPKASFLTTKYGVLQEKAIKKEDIKKATNEIKEFVPDFDYDIEYQKT